MSQDKLFGLREMKPRKAKYGFSMHLGGLVELSKFIVSTLGDAKPSEYKININTMSGTVTIHTDSDDLATRIRQWVA